MIIASTLCTDPVIRNIKIVSMILSNPSTSNINITSMNCSYNYAYLLHNQVYDRVAQSKKLALSAHTYHFLPC